MGQGVVLFSCPAPRPSRENESSKANRPVIPRPDTEFSWHNPLKFVLFIVPPAIHERLRAGASRSPGFDTREFC
ncbi:hypothetical protein Pan44_32640 [Caulifigura coniformis]|uniref:Uncharacterized protein n=1 Tax=Caulifigura coniformis TaxID=2527983 RepID=A0A517SGG9_9PLAN|nr:hypothetical protein Pan44_32640 [Caulifigura coniformis]